MSGKPFDHGLDDPNFRYRDSAATDVAATIEAERQRIGALTGEQVRAQRKARQLADQQPIPTHGDVVISMPAFWGRKP
jgi:hypothetical protein